MPGSNPQNPYNRKDLPGYDPSQPEGFDPQATDAATNLGYFSSQPDILSRSMMRDQGHGGQNYGFDPYSQYLQNRSLAGATLGTYLSGSTNPNTVMDSAKGYYGGMWNSDAAVNALRALGVNVKKFEDAGATPGGVAGLQGAATDPNMVAAMSAWQDPQAAMKLVESAMAGLPTPLANSLGSLSTMLYHMFTDAKPGLGNMSFLNWLIGDQGHQNVPTPSFNPGSFATPAGYNATNPGF